MSSTRPRGTILEDEPMMDEISCRCGSRSAVSTARLTTSFLNQAWGPQTSAFTGILQITGFPTFAKEADEPLQVSITRAIEAINGPAGDRHNWAVVDRRETDAIYVTVARLLGVHATAGCPRQASWLAWVSERLPQLRVAGIPVMQCQALPSWEHLGHGPDVYPHQGPASRWSYTGWSGWL